MQIKKRDKINTCVFWRFSFHWSERRLVELKKAQNLKIVECMKINVFAIRKQTFQFGTNLIEAPKLKRTYSQCFNGPR